MPEMNHTDESQRLDRLDSKGNWVYPSGSETGHVEIELPALPGSPNQTERLHVRDFGVHVVSQIERSMNRDGYLKSGPQQTPAQTFRHYVASAKGAQLFDGPAMKRMEQLAQEFEGEADWREYFDMVIKPHLLSLGTRRR